MAFDRWEKVFMMAAIVTFTLGMFVKIGWLAVRRVPVMRIKGKGDKVGISIELSLMALISLWIYDSVQWAIGAATRKGLLAGILPWLYEEWGNAILLRELGALMIAGALLVWVSAQIALGTSYRIGTDEVSAGALVTDGIYRYTRNPIYLFFSLFMLGSVLLSLTAFGLVHFALFGPLLHIQVLREEAQLLKLYGQLYEDYSQRAPRYSLRSFFSRGAKSEAAQIEEEA